MMLGWTKTKVGGRTFLGRLRTDVRGNTLAMMAAALIPLAGMVGGGIDLARMYITKTRLQHACDAGALAGRKAMGGGQWAQDNGRPNTTARNFFAANYKIGSFGSSGLDYRYAESSGKVTGNASALLPMTLTRVIGQTEATIDVTCEAEMRLPNTDVMFVLDNTGSMGDKATSTDTQTKLQALKSAVKCFYEILARLDTTEVCVGDPPSGGTSGEVQIRFGFVPYDMNVNVGHLLPSNYFVDQWSYQSREVTEVSGRKTGAYSDKITTAYDDVYSGDQREIQLSEQACRDAIKPSEYGTIGITANGGSEGFANQLGIQSGSGTWRANQTVKDFKRKFISYKSGICTYQYDSQTSTRTWDFEQVAPGTANSFVFKAWLYKPRTINVAELKDGSGWRSDYKYTVPALNAAGTTKAVWDGCIEERDTVRQSSYSPIPTGAHDLQIDELPTSDATRWRPALTSATFPRKPTYDNSTASPDSWTTDQIKTFNTFTGSAYSCVLEAKPLQTWPTAAPFESYVDSMVKGGNTYHDIGMVWGARFLSPNGIFKATNEYTPRGGQIQRHLIFMTDGDACTESHNYQAYGIAWYERRQTDPATVPTDGCSSSSVPGTLTDQVDARTRALCTAVKNMKDTTLWVIWFGARNPKIETSMTACASPDRFFAARDASSLQNTFRQIANQISQLRITN
jgi:Flp pilus assembly protein TadG